MAVIGGVGLVVGVAAPPTAPDEQVYHSMRQRGPVRISVATTFTLK